LYLPARALTKRRSARSRGIYSQQTLSLTTERPIKPALFSLFLGASLVVASLSRLGSSDVKDKQVSVKQARAAYYNLPRLGVMGYRCEVATDWRTILGNLLDADDLRQQLITGMLPYPDDPYTLEEKDGGYLISLAEGSSRGTIRMGRDFKIADFTTSLPDAVTIAVHRRRPRSLS
jgi:hypothetical protein